MYKSISEMILGDVGSCLSFDGNWNGTTPLEAIFIEKNRYDGIQKVLLFVMASPLLILIYLIQRCCCSIGSAGSSFTPLNNGFTSPSFDDIDKRQKESLKRMQDHRKKEIESQNNFARQKQMEQEQRLREQQQALIKQHNRLYY